MSRSEDIVTETPNVPLGDLLQKSHSDHIHTDDAQDNILDKEEEIGGNDEKVDCNDKLPVSTVTQTTVLHNEMKHAGTITVDYRKDLSIKNSKGELNPDFEFENNVQSFLQLSGPRSERRFRNSQGREHHIQTQALSSCPTQRHKCSLCKRSFSTLFSRLRHEKQHENRKGRIKSHKDSTFHIGPDSGKPSIKTTQNLDSVRFKAAEHGQKNISDKTHVSKVAHVCKYCKKLFSTRPSLRRHQRRIHERQLRPRQFFKKVQFPKHEKELQLKTIQDTNKSDPQITEDTEHELKYMVDISSNISENLSFYIDGKIVSTSAVSNYKVMETNSAMIGLVIEPAQLSQALDLEINIGNLTLDRSALSSTRRRTSTPPLLPQIKSELESETSLSSSSSSLSTTGSLITAHLPQYNHKEKTVYLSPKLQQIIQNQDIGPNLVSPNSLTVLPSERARFKRRTTSPPSSRQKSPDVRVDSGTAHQTFDSHNECAYISGTCSNQRVSPLTNISDETPIQRSISPLDCSISRIGGSMCNQQPLDLSNSMGLQENSEDSILDLSISGTGFNCEDSAGSKSNSILPPEVRLNAVDIAPVETIPNDEGVFCSPEMPNLTVVKLSDTCATNPENILLNLALPSPSIHLNSSFIAPVAIHQSTLVPPPPQCLTSLPHCFLPFLPSSTMDPNPQSFSSSLLLTEAIPLSGSAEVDNPLHFSQGDLNVAIPDGVTCAPGALAHTVLPTLPCLQDPLWITDPALCELSQRTLVVDSVLSSDAQMFSASLPSDPSNVAPLALPLSTIVIEYTVALQSAENILPGNSAHCLSDKMPVDPIHQEAYEPSQLSPDTAKLPETSPRANHTHLASAEAFEQSSTDGLSALTVVKAECEDEKEENDRLFPDHDNQMEELPPSHSFCKNFTCNVCQQPFKSMKSLGQHIIEHSTEWPYKCEFCVQLFKSDTGLLEHRSSYHGIGQNYVCKSCSKEFAFLCNLEQHQKDLHPGHESSHAEVVHGKLRPENHNSPKTDIFNADVSATENNYESDNMNTEPEIDSNEDLLNTIKTLASEGIKPKGPDVRLGIIQHYPSFKPPPFPYHSRSTNDATAVSATSFTTHNIPQTFSTAIRCTKCGKSFDNMPELHKHILACANASDKKRYTPKKNPIPLKQFAKAQGVLSPKIVNSRLNLSQKFLESAGKIKMGHLNKRKSHLVHKGRPSGGRKTFTQDDLNVFPCPHCGREFTYNASLKKHVVFSCPSRPPSRRSKRKTLCHVSTQENSGSLRRQLANINLKPQGSNQGPKAMNKNQFNKSNALDGAQGFRVKRSTVLSAAVSTKKGQLKESFVSQTPSKPRVLSSVVQQNSQDVELHVLGRTLEQRAEDLKILSPKVDRLSPRLRERATGPITRSVQNNNAP